MSGSTANWTPISTPENSTKAFFDSIPGNKKEFLIMKGATHAKISRDNWESVVDRLNRTFAA